MKSKYLVQVAGNNAMHTVNRFFTFDGAMTKAVAEEKAAAVRSAEEHARKDQAREIRVISAKKWAEEIREANREAFAKMKKEVAEYLASK